MKSIHLLRHAKSSWAQAGLIDKERPLNDRGIKDCARMGPAIYDSGYRFENVFCSAGLRARQTIELISSATPGVSINWLVEEALYTFDSAALLGWCCNLDDTLDDVMVVGHNPAISELSSKLADRFVEEIPTCSYIKIKTEVEHWAELDRRCGDIARFIYPKML